MLIVDKFVTGKLTRNRLYNKLSDKMSLIDEYGENKEKKGIKKGFERGENKIIGNLLKSGMSAEMIATTANVSLTRVKAIEKTLKSEK